MEILNCLCLENVLIYSGHSLVWPLNVLVHDGSGLGKYLPLHRKFLSQPSTVDSIDIKVGIIYFFFMEGPIYLFLKNDLAHGELGLNKYFPIYEKFLGVLVYHG